MPTPYSVSPRAATVPLMADPTPPARWSRSLLAGMRSSFSTTLGLSTPWDTSEHLSSLTVTDLYPGVDPDELVEHLPLSRSLAMSVPAIARARHVVVTAIAGLPLVPVRRVESPPQLFTRLDPGRPDVVTLAYLVDAMFFYGRGWLLKMGRDVADRPLALRWVDELDVELDPTTRAPVRLRSTGQRITRDDLVLVEHIGEGVLAPSAGLTIRRSRRADAAAARAMDNPVPSVELHQTVGDALPDAEVDALIRRWADARRGRNGGVAYTSPGVEARTHGQAAEQLLISGRNASAIDCARVAGVPSWVVDASLHNGSSLTYTNVPSRSRELLDYTLRGYLDAIAGRLSLDDVTPHGQALRFDVSRLLRGDFAERMNAGRVAIESGIYTAEQIRVMDQDTPTTTDAAQTRS